MASLAQVTDVRLNQSDTGTHPLARLWANLTDAQLLTHLTRASRKVEGIVGSRLVPFTTTETRTFTRSKLNVTAPANLVEPWTTQWATYVGLMPVLRPESWSGTVTSITALDTTDNPETVNLTGIVFTTSTGRILLPSTAFDQITASGWPNAYTVDVAYSGGYSTVPEDLIEATILLAADSWLVGVDSRSGQPDAADLYMRAMSELKPWIDARVPTIA